MGPPTHPGCPRGTPDPSRTAPRVPDSSRSYLMVQRTIPDFPKGPPKTYRTYPTVHRPIEDVSEGPPTHPGRIRGTNEPSRTSLGVP